MNFTSIKEVEQFKGMLQPLSNSVQGRCYLEQNSNTVYKFFEDWEDDEFNDFSSEQLLQFKDIKTDTFIFPQECLYLNERVIGYTTKYVLGKLLCKTNPLTINLNSFIEMLKTAISDIEYITHEGVNIYDLMYNIMLGNGIYIIDTVEYTKRLMDYDILYQKNIRGFNIEISKYLIDGYFNELINNHKILLKMYNSSNQNMSIIEFVTTFKEYISNTLGHEIETLAEAKKLMNKNEHKLTYKRD